MDKTLMLAFVLTVAFVNRAEAIVCYSRSSTTTSTNGTQIATCTAAGAFCYSYTSNFGSLQMNYASCGTVCTYASCTTCNTDYCNTLTPSAISCYTRSSTTTTDNGVMSTCPTGISSCYTQFSNGESGCGACTAAYTQYYGCTTCTTNNCNTLTPSSISCYTRSTTTSLLSNGAVTTCPTPVSSCYGHIDGEGGCGICTTNSTAHYGCTSCTSSSCNVRPTTVKCYYISDGSQGATRIRTNCNTATSCYEYQATNGSYFAGCGLCLTSQYPSCRVCTTDYCNSATMAGSSMKMAVVSAAILAIVKLF